MKNVIVFTMLMGFTLAGFAQKADSTKTPKIKLNSTYLTATEPLMVVNGTKQVLRGISSVKDLDPTNIKAVTILKDSSAIAKYGADGFAGVIEIETKNTDSTGNSIIKAKPIKPVDLHLNGKVTGFKVNPMPNGQLPVKKRYLLNRDFDPKAKMLYIIDGKEVADPKINEQSIKSVEVLKDSSATTLYGDKGKNGVIIITTNKATSKKN
ncbi:hypothetical protein ASE74_03315 [Pedobacter sp. Leaf216]|uniref:TonB-dependent receptor plug domain-containing protein n=1 Tax=Pedobacter sp. Leaf216 TaxID=1735684 RepID=UPI0006FD863D|nr:TonB-dependent receptor plug domain-containing protein [Pedobacter sp. Leaf216]KQM75018.1 hypothetical protein ASE74_03315 [Pedobacter sp. Leaf216]